MTAFGRDTSPEAAAEVVRISRDMSVEDKIRQVFALTDMVRKMAMLGLRQRYPEASPQELQRRLAALVLDADTVRRVYGWDPDKEGY